MNNIFLKILEEEKHQLLQKLNILDQAISAYHDAEDIKNDSASVNVYASVANVFGSTSAGEFFFRKYNAYEIAAPIRNKITSIIKTEKRFLHVREIARIMLLLEGGGSLKELIRKISPALSVLKKSPDTELISIEADGLHFNTFWGFKAWITNEGLIDPLYMYNREEITKKKRLVIH